MTRIRSRKHSNNIHVKLSPSFITLAAMAMPLAVQAQQTAPSQTLPEVKVEATADAPYKADAVSSPKYSQPLVNTPQTISVIRQEIIQEQGSFTLTEALRNTPGITLQLGENGNTRSGDAISMRGFDTQGSIFVDGVRDLSTYTRDTFNIEQVEVVKGPTGADVGRASAGGYVNLVTKTPMAADAYSSSVSYGSADRYRVTGDLNKGLDIGGEKNAGFRLNVMTQGGGVAGRDYVENESFGIAPSFVFGLNSPTRTTLSYLYMKQNNRPDGGVPVVGLPNYNVATGSGVTAAQAAAGRAAPAPNSENFYGSIRDFDDVEVNMLTARVEHDFSSKLKLRNTFRVGKTEQDRMTTSIVGPTFTTPGVLSSYVVARNRGDALNRNSDGGQGRRQTNDIITNQTHLSIDFETGGIEHNLGTGLELTYEKQNKRYLAGASGGTGLNGGTIPAANLYNPDPYFTLVGYDPRDSGAYDRAETKTIGVYVFDTLKLNDQWQLSAGIRADRYDTDFDALRLAGSTSGGGGATPPTPLASDTRTSLSEKDTLISYKVGALYKPTTNSSVYALYSISKRPPGGDSFSLSSSATSADNPELADPQKATNVEVGAKWDVSRNFALTAAIFNTENENEAVTEDNVTRYIGERRVRGVEIGGVGQITPAWQLSAGLTYLDGEITRGVRSGTSANQGGVIAFTPEWAFSSWTTYRLPFGLTIGGGARYVGEQKRSSTTNAAPSTGITKIDDYWVYDAVVGYAVNKNFDIQLNLYNLADKKYAASVNSGGSRYTPGVERSALLTANFRY